jgi:hypothetical protein
MAATTYFGNRARAAVVAPGATPILSDLFYVDRGFEATFEWENVELYGTDSIFRVDEARHTFKASASLRGCKFNPIVSVNPATPGSGIGSRIYATLNPTSYDGTVLDSNTLSLNDVYIWETGTDTPGTNRFAVKVSNAYLENLPIPFTENDFIILDLKFHGRTGAIVNSGVPVA